MRERVRVLAQENIEPRSAEIDARGEFPRDVFQALQREGLVGLHVPGEYGGAGADAIAFAILIEEIARVCASSSLIPGGSKLGALPLLLAGSEEQKKRYLPGVASGEALISFCMTEPEAGSDSAALRTTALRRGDSFVLDGTKRFVTNAGVSRHYVVMAKTHERYGGISCLVVPADVPGVSVGKPEPKMGIRGSPTAEVVFHGCRVPAENLVGDFGRGYPIAMSTLDHSRCTVAAQAVGIAQGAYEAARHHVIERRASARAPQGLELMLADMAMQIEAARLLAYRACAAADDDDGDLSVRSSYAKCYASDVAVRVTADAVQVLGDEGYTSVYPVERMMRDAKITQIYEGTNEIQRVLIARNALR